MIGWLRRLIALKPSMQQQKFAAWGGMKVGYQYTCPASQRKQFKTVQRWRKSA